MRQFSEEKFERMERNTMYFENKWQSDYSRECHEVMNFPTHRKTKKANVNMDAKSHQEKR